MQMFSPRICAQTPLNRLRICQAPAVRRVEAATYIGKVCSEGLYGPARCPRPPFRLPYKDSI